MLDIVEFWIFVRNAPASCSAGSDKSGLGLGCEARIGDGLSIDSAFLGYAAVWHESLDTYSWNDLCCIVVLPSVSDSVLLFLYSNLGSSTILMTSLPCSI